MKIIQAVSFCFIFNHLNWNHSYLYHNLTYRLQFKKEFQSSSSGAGPSSMDTSQILADNYDSESETSETRRNKPVRNKVKKEPKKIKEETKDQKIMRAINRTAPGDLPPSKFFNPNSVQNQGSQFAESGIYWPQYPNGPEMWRVIQTKAILLLKSLSARDGSEIQRL